ncbi:MAG TPA: methyltransferase domain-containing protein [Steroidobacteraceae bacterium]|jgi:SAM-dependent methyltransferase
MSSEAAAVEAAGTARARVKRTQAAAPYLTFDAMNEMLRARLETLPGPVRILEAGCGRNWPLKLSVPFTLTGLDLDADALAARTDLHQAVVGDLRTADFAPHSFDVIYNAFVLEHVSGARQVLDRFMRWLAPGGMLILKVPDRDSAYGFLTRMTPFWAHVMIYRHVLGYRQAGTLGHGPYRTYYDRVVSERGLRSFCLGNGMKSELYRLCSYAGDRRMIAAAFLTSMLSGGRLPWRHNNLLLIARTSTSR